MNKLLLAVLLLISPVVFAAQKAMTESGEIVILNNDGTWEFEDGSTQNQIETTSNSTHYKLPQSSTFKINSAKTNLGLWIDPAKWQFLEKGSINKEAEFEFKHKNHDLYAMVITEAIEIELESLVEIAFQTLQQAAKTAKLVKKEYRTVNGEKVIYMEMAAVISGVKATYLGYYYSNSRGSNQVVTFTGTNLMKQYEPEMIDLLNGLVVQ